MAKAKPMFRGTRIWHVWRREDDRREGAATFLAYGSGLFGEMVDFDVRERSPAVQLQRLGLDSSAYVWEEQECCYEIWSEEEMTWLLAEQLCPVGSDADAYLKAVKAGKLMPEYESDWVKAYGSATKRDEDLLIRHRARVALAAAEDAARQYAFACGGPAHLA